MTDPNGGQSASLWAFASGHAAIVQADDLALHVFRQRLESHVLVDEGRVAAALDRALAVAGAPAFREILSGDRTGVRKEKRGRQAST